MPGSLGNADVPVPRPASEAGQAVSLLTMHGAKGLEWPVVIVADLGWTPPNGGGSVTFSPEYGVACTSDAEAAKPPVTLAGLTTREGSWDAFIRDCARSA